MAYCARYVLPRSLAGVLRCCSIVVAAEVIAGAVLLVGGKSDALGTVSPTLRAAKVTFRQWYVALKRRVS